MSRPRHLGPPDLTLEGRFVRLVPTHPDHAPGLADLSRAGELHRLWYTSVPHPEDMAAEIDARLSARDHGEVIPFTHLAPNGTPLGMTTFLNIDHTLPRVEIGNTWIGSAAQRGPINTEAKFLMLRHAFEVWGCTAVEFRTHRLNTQSRRAIERLGAQLDGVLRAHRRMADGSLRDTACYSITAPEWDAVKSHLIWQLDKPR